MAWTPVPELVLPPKGMLSHVRQGKCTDSVHSLTLKEPLTCTSSKVVTEFGPVLFLFRFFGPEARGVFAP